MNSPGQKLVDSFETEELSAVHHVFLRGARIFHAHSTLQKFGEMGYLSDWARAHFSNTKAKNDFFDQFGDIFSPRGDARLQDSLSSEKAPEEVLGLAREAMNPA